MLQITNADFEKEVTECNEPVFIDFYAEWCGPCKTMFPIIQAIETQFPNVKFCKVNADSDSELCSQFRIRSLPTFIVIDAQKNEHVKVGSQAQGTLIEWLESILSKE